MSPLVLLAIFAQPDMPEMLSRYSEDLELIQRSYPVAGSRTRTARLRSFFAETKRSLDAVDFDHLGKEDQIDAVLLGDDIRRRTRQLDLDEETERSIAPLIPFAGAARAFAESRTRMETPVAREAATQLDALGKAIERATQELQGRLEAKRLVVTNGVDAAPAGTELAVSRSVANRAVQALSTIRRGLDEWFRFYDGYDPQFSWWCQAPYKAATEALDRHLAFVRDRLVGIRADDKTTIIGFPIGREALMTELRAERISYTPEELIAIADREYAWCESEMKKASREMGFGDDWKKALEKVKNSYVEPGKQPDLILGLAKEAEEYVEKNDLVTVPPLAKETWRMEMLSPERQLQSPFFLGGEHILVSYPTDTMAHDAKLMSLRGNNPYFSRATVFHELIPGHELQGFMNARYRPYRQAFGTPFFWEGNSLYWEMTMYDRGFHATPEQRVGALFWRMHRCARVQFSLGFHLGRMTPAQCVDLLVDKVGHERDNALAEVRRSFSGGYGPLYQIAYLMGGLQFRAMAKEAMPKMSPKAFHDALLHEGPIPVDLVRAAVLNKPLQRDTPTNWRFADGL